MTVKEAAAELGVSVSLVYALCSSGAIRHERHGLGRGTIRIPPQALADYRRAAEAHPRLGGGRGTILCVPCPMPSRA